MLCQASQWAEKCLELTKQRFSELNNKLMICPVLQVCGYTEKSQNRGLGVSRLGIQWLHSHSHD